MDRVRLGRALGTGTRHAAKSLMEIAGAAMAPDPNPAPQPRPTPQPATPRSSPASTARPTVHSVAQGSRRFSESFFSRLSRLGGALWLELTGVFFGIFALFAAEGVWKTRAAFHPGAPSELRQKLLLAAVIALAFGYFCISSFLRARRRERGQHKRR